MRGLKHAGSTLALGGLLLVAACGRIGFQFGHAPAASHDAGHHDGAVADAQQRRDAGPSQAMSDAAARDAGSAHDSSVAASDASLRHDAGVPATDAAHAPGPLGSKCGTREECSSGHCIGAICCAFACDLPPECRTATGATCTDGHACAYPIDATAACSDGDPCTIDSCATGSCTSTPPDCNDSDSCTTDSCTTTGCSHVNHCPPNSACSYARFAGHGYWSCPGPSTWNAAEAACKNVGVHLVSLDNQAEHDFVWSQAGAVDTWIGYTDAAQEGTWRWVDGDTSTYTHWNSGTPSTSNTRNCARLLASAGGLWNDQACSQQHHFVCERTSKVAPDPLCSYARQGARAYWVCETAQLWDEAENHCQSVGLELVTLHDAAENSFLQSQLVSASYFVGYSDAASEGTFVWADGSSSTYTHWGGAQPDNSTGSEDFVTIAKSDGTWSTGTNAAKPYICEDPNP